MGDSLKMPIRISWTVGMGKCVRVWVINVDKTVDCAFCLYVYAYGNAYNTRNLQNEQTNGQRIVVVNIYITLFSLFIDMIDFDCVCDLLLFHFYPFIFSIFYGFSSRCLGSESQWR